MPEKNTQVKSNSIDYFSSDKKYKTKENNNLQYLISIGNHIKNLTFSRFLLFGFILNLFQSLIAFNTHHYWLVTICWSLITSHNPVYAPTYTDPLPISHIPDRNRKNK